MSAKRSKNSGPEPVPIPEPASGAAAVSTAAIIRRGDEVLVGLRSAGGDVGNRWEFPGGKSEPGESPEAALRRELHEELGIDAEIGAMIGATRFSHRGREIRLIAFEVTTWNGALQTHEHRALRWAAAPELDQLALVESDRWLYENLVRSGFFDSLQ